MRGKAAITRKWLAPPAGYTQPQVRRMSQSVKQSKPAARLLRAYPDEQVPPNNGNRQFKFLKRGVGKRRTFARQPQRGEISQPRERRQRKTCPPKSLR